MIQESVISNILDIQNDYQHEEEKKSESSISNESEQKKEKLLLISESNDEEAKIEMKPLEQDAREEDKNILDSFEISMADNCKFWTGAFKTPIELKERVAKN